jgi:hypothetical protein
VRRHISQSFGLGADATSSLIGVKRSAKGDPATAADAHNIVASRSPEAHGRFFADIAKSSQVMLVRAASGRGSSTTG